MLPLTYHGGARRRRVSAGVRTGRPERRGGPFVVRRMSVGAGVAEWGRYWGGRGVLPLAFHGGARQGRVGPGVRIGWPERRGSAVRRKTHERRGRGVGYPCHVPASVSPCAVPTSRAGLHVAVRGEEGSCPTPALAVMLCHIRGGEHRYSRQPPYPRVRVGGGEETPN